MYIQKATINELDSVSELFDLYRVFYEQPSNLEAAKDFIRNRMVNEESVIFLAQEGDISLGFVQLYPSFSSVSMKRSWVLNDLYVKKEARGKGVGEGLMQAALRFAEETGAKGVLLETGKENTTAQSLYEKIGFIKETNYFYYYTI
jgi:ribosomal protein S18 acetylase RimI-like enzyme